MLKLKQRKKTTVLPLSHELGIDFNMHTLFFILVPNFLIKHVRALILSTLTIVAIPGCYVERGGTKRSPIRSSPDGQGAGNTAQGGNPSTGGNDVIGGQGGEAGFSNNGGSENAAGVIIGMGGEGGEPSPGGNENTGGLNEPLGGQGGESPGDPCDPYDVDCQCNADEDCLPTPCFSNGRCLNNRCEYDLLSDTCCSAQDFRCTEPPPNNCIETVCTVAEGAATGECEFSVNAGTLADEGVCCTNSMDCRSIENDGNLCTSPICNPISNTCAEEVRRPNCCLNENECIDMEGEPQACHVWGCTDRVCEEIPIEGCCTTGDDCPDDGNPCTQNVCENGICSTNEIEDCCNPSEDVEEQCSDLNDCTIDTCEPIAGAEGRGTCSHELENEITIDGEQQTCCRTSQDDCQVLFDSPHGIECVGVRCIYVDDPEINQTQVCSLIDTEIICYQDVNADNIGDPGAIAVRNCENRCFDCSAECNEFETPNPPPD